MKLPIFLFTVLATLALLAQGGPGRPGPGRGRGARPASALPATAPQVQPEPAEAEAKDAAPAGEDYNSLLTQILDNKDEELSIEIVRCKYVSAETLRRLVENFLSPAGTAARSDEDDVLVVSDTPSRLENIRSIIEQSDQPVPQVLVEARIVEFELGDELTKDVDIGIQHIGDSAPLRQMFNSLMFPNGYSGGSDSIYHTEAFGGGSSGRVWLFGGPDTFKLWALVNFLQTRNHARLLSSPNIVIRRGADGNITTGEKVPIETETTTGSSISKSTRFENVGVKLIVRPIMISGNRIRMRLNPEFSNISRYDVTSKAPYIGLRSASTELDAYDGQMIVLGGLLRNEESTTETAVPFLSRIPILGALFRGKKTKTLTSQLVIFITPHLIRPENAEAREALQLGGTTEELRRRIETIEANLSDERNNVWRKAEPLETVDLRDGAGEDPAAADGGTK